MATEGRSLQKVPSFQGLSTAQVDGRVLKSQASLDRDRLNNNGGEEGRENRLIAAARELDKPSSFNRKEVDLANLQGGTPQDTLEAIMDALESDTAVIERLGLNERFQATVDIALEEASFMAHVKLGLEVRTHACTLWPCAVGLLGSAPAASAYSDLTGSRIKRGSA